MGTSGLLSGPDAAGSNRPPSTNQFVEIMCDNYELRTNVAYFREQVHVSEREGDQLQGQMICSQMTLTLSGTNQPQKMVAEHQVVIGQEDKEFRAEKAEYTGTNGLLELTGDPQWKAGPREGKGDLIRVVRDEMLVRGNAFMRLPANELGQSVFQPGGQAQARRAEGGDQRVRGGLFRGVFSCTGFGAVSGPCVHRPPANELD